MRYPWATPNRNSTAIREKWTFAGLSPAALARSMTSSIDAPNRKEKRPRILPSTKTKVVSQAAVSLVPWPPHASGEK